MVPQRQERIAFRIIGSNASFWDVVSHYAQTRDLPINTVVQRGAQRHELPFAKAESVDINRLDGKRDLDFTIDTRSCRIEGFVTTYRCGQTIVRTGKERKASEVTFTVQVKKR